MNTIPPFAGGQGRDPRDVRETGAGLLAVLLIGGGLLVCAGLARWALS